MRCGNPCALCCLNLPNGCKRVCIFQLIYHGVCFCIYLGILSAIVVKAVQKMMPAETFVETYWEYTALTSIHGLHLIIWIPLYFAVKYVEISTLTSYVVYPYISTDGFSIDLLDLGPKRFAGSNPTDNL
ncbi:unnamed protein product [Allacma fusca]|uniref:Uncharacterized protein n=1 Tax=Allacma fusca TaxID=39272 RepID=A0A8J2JA43_9HEXA|nr:unnamed protein product [Allacma fusca]